MFSTCQNYISEKLSYSRELDDLYVPTDRIENKSAYHLMDSERYLESEFDPLMANPDVTDVAPVGKMRR